MTESEVRGMDPWQEYVSKTLAKLAVEADRVQNAADDAKREALAARIYSIVAIVTLIVSVLIMLGLKSS